MKTWDWVMLETFTLLDQRTEAEMEALRREVAGGKKRKKTHEPISNLRIWRDRWACQTLWPWKAAIARKSIPFGMMYRLLFGMPI
jgi:hypothetical protein